LTDVPHCIMSLKVPTFSMFARPLVPKWHTPADFFFESGWRPMLDVMSNVWFLSTVLAAWLGRPALGKVHLGKSCLVDGLTEASGTYLPGPTDAGVDV